MCTGTHLSLGAQNTFGNPELSSLQSAAQLSAESQLGFVLPSRFCVLEGISLKNKRWVGKAQQPAVGMVVMCNQIRRC